MAYVGTAKVLGNSQDTLRSVVLGEAANQGLTGQQAVADVIYNRAALGSFPGGSDPIAVATAPQQFQGQVDLSRYSPSQIATADQAIASAQAGQDVTGGATYYANPGKSSASWARNLDGSNSLQIGDHYFTDNTKGNAFQPNFGTGFTTNDNFPGGTGDPTLSGNYNPVAGYDVGGGMNSGGFVPDGHGSYLGGLPQYGATEPSPSNYDVGGGMNSSYPPSTSTIVPGVGGASDASTFTQSPGDMIPDPNTGGMTQAPTTYTAANGTTTLNTPTTSSGGNSEVQKANPSTLQLAVATGADEQSAQAKQNTDTATKTATTIYSQIFAGVGDAISRFGLVALGLVLLAGGLWIVAGEERIVPSPSTALRAVKRAGRTVMA